MFHFPQPIHQCTVARARKPSKAARGVVMVMSIRQRQDRDAAKYNPTFLHTKNGLRYDPLDLQNGDDGCASDAGDHAEKTMTVG